MTTKYGSFTPFWFPIKEHFEGIASLWRFSGQLGQKKSMPDCGLAEFQIRPVLLYGKVVCA